MYYMSRQIEHYMYSIYYLALALALYTTRIYMYMYLNIWRRIADNSRALVHLSQIHWDIALRVLM